MGKRKCIATLANPGFDAMASMSEEGCAEPQTIQTDCIFHQWGDRLNRSTNNGPSVIVLSETIGIVEEEETGQVHRVHPDRIKFTN